jgi:hypothetical protein
VAADRVELNEHARTAASGATATGSGGLAAEEWTRYVSGLAYVDSCVG